MKKTLPLIAAASFAAFTTAQAQVIFSENFDGEVDQAALVASDGDASTSFGANSAIGDTNATGDAASGGAFASTGTDLWTRNGTRGYTAAKDVLFTSATGGVGQLHSHTAGGFMLMSTGPLVSNIPTPIAQTANIGDIFRVTFDMFVQAETAASGLNMNWLNDSTTGNVAQVWTEYTDALVGDVVSVTQDLTIVAGLEDLTGIALQVGLSNGGGSDYAYNAAFMQVDNFQIEYIAVPEPGTYALLAGLVALSFAAVRRRK